VRKGFDYSLGTHECLLSGTVGSGKTLPAAHIIASHAIMYPGANFGIGRRTLPDLKDTLCAELQEHLFGCGIEYTYSKATGDFEFSNRSKISAHSWADGNYKKFGSQKFSGFAIEEAQENKDDHAYNYILTRIGRLPHIDEKVLLLMCNPDSPSHWIAQKFKIGSGKSHGTIDRVGTTKHVYYSFTEHNRFLPPSYIAKLKTDLDPKLARRLIHGEWIEIDKERIYHAYSSERNYRPDVAYVVNPRFPIHLSFDFNIARGKPLSAIFGQYIDKKFHYFAETVVEGLNTEQNLEESAGKGLFEYKNKFIIHGDAAGKSSDTRSNRTDYDIIRQWLSRYRRKDGASIEVEIQVPASNPSVRDRHNRVNAHCLNANGEVRLFLYKGCRVADEGLRLTALKDSSQYIEDDSKPYQHITTAIGYDVCTTTKFEGHGGATMIARAY
jgi:hypothetical protein